MSRKEMLLAALLVTGPLSFAVMFVVFVTSVIAAMFYVDLVTPFNDGMRSLCNTIGCVYPAPAYVWVVVSLFSCMALLGLAENGYTDDAFKEANQ